jgi:ribose transport system ATP-binding protein
MARTLAEPLHPPAAGADDHADEVLRLERITKRYPGVVALDDVAFSVRPREVHALLGENGAGKSTLMAVAAGVTVPDDGTVTIGGTPLGNRGPRMAQELGLAVVYQHPVLLDDLTITENLTFAMPPGRRPPRRSRSTWARDRLALVGSQVDPGLRAGDLAVAERQLVEIARALALDARVLILDEPTESLTAAESERLFQQIDRVRAAGTGVVYISHRYPDVRRLADRVTVLRDGRVRGTGQAVDLSEDDVVELITGRRVDRVFPSRPSPVGTTAPVAVQARDLRSHRLAGIDVTVRRGEIVGLAGVEGNGQREVVRALAGLHRHTGTVLVDGREVRLASPADASAAGVVHLPGDRHAEGVFLPRPIRENISALVLNSVSRLGWLHRRQEARLAEGWVDRLRVAAPGIETPVGSLSGGNQQKVVFVRSLAAEPEVLVADEPTRGVDVGARIEIYALLRAYAEAGHGVLVLSTDAVELAGLCDRVLVLSRGAVVSELAGDGLSERSITGAAVTAVRQEAAPPERTNDRAPRRRWTPTGQPSWWSRLVGGDYLPSAVLVAVITSLAIVTAVQNDRFLGARNLSSMMLLASILVLVACGQLIVLLVASIDLSVGPVMGLTVVVMSFFATGEAGTLGLLAGAGAALAMGVAVGLANGVGIRLLGIPPVIATLVLFIFLQGIALVLRPTPDGLIDQSTAQLIQSRIGIVPVVALLALLLVLVLEWALRRSRAGVELRAVGSDEGRALRLGARPTATVLLAHVMCSVLAVSAGLVLTSLVGIGQAGLATEYTLTSITAVVLGGASIFGGRGSFLGALFGAVLIQEIISATSFLGLGEAWQQWLPGLLVLAGAGFFSWSKARRDARRE